tara:strand:- start:195 stop:602 length:408 start_codon:yes stop_codon:yes gene_type:complete
LPFTSSSVPFTLRRKLTVLQAAEYVTSLVDLQALLLYIGGRDTHSHKQGDYIMDLDDIRQAMLALDTADLNEIIDLAHDLKTLKCRVSLKVGQNVFVVQKTKRTAGIIEKINQKKAQVRMRGSIYNVPFSMIEAA